MFPKIQRHHGEKWTSPRTLQLCCPSFGRPSFSIARAVNYSFRPSYRMVALAKEATMKTDRNWVEQARLNEARLEAVLKLSQMAEASLQQITDFALEQAVALTKSNVGYIAFMSEDETVFTMHSWSKEAMAECAIADKPLVYPVAATGLWGEAARQRKPIVTNDYPAPNPLKKGLPEGHVPLRRHMNVPIVDQGRIVVVAGVGNKEEEYDGSDVRQLTLLMEGMWTLIQRQRMQTELRRHREQLEQLVEARTAELIAANEQLKQEVEQRRRAEDDLAIFRRFAEASAEGFGMSDLDGRISYVNPAMCRLFGEDRPEEVIGQSAIAYFADEYKQRRQTELLPALLREGGWRAEQTIVPRHGKPIQTLQSTFLIRDEDGSPFRIAVLISDITERKQAEEALRDSEERFRVAFEEAPVGMVIGIGDGVIAKANRAMCRISDYTAEELTGRHVREFTHPEDRPLSAPLVKKLLAGEIPSFSLEKRYLAKGGRVFYAQATTAAIRNPDGTVAFALGIIEDITERKQAEEALRREHRTLKHMLQSSDHERQLIAYEIHDGLAQQLAAAIMQFDTFDHLKETKPSVAAKAFDGGMTMLRQGHFEARRLISGVRPPILDESGVVEAIAHLVHEESRRKGPKIESHSKVDFDRLVPILENAIYRIVQESVTNACKHSKSQNVRISLLQRGSQIRIEIRDWGIGFDPKAVRKNRFGLTGIRERARLLGGKCNIRTKPGKGTSIVVELPVVEREEEE
jgi:PAS domain S-box-containing protein